MTKTRFKTWWDLVGWPMEFAAKLADITVDCTELLRAGEAEDDEASAVSVAISILREIWGEETFTAKDAVKILTPESKLNGAVGIELDDANKARSDALADVLDEFAVGLVARSHGAGRTKFGLRAGRESDTRDQSASHASFSAR